MTILSKIEQAQADIKAELLRAKQKHGAQFFSSYHEGYGVLLEEVDELWDEIKEGKQNPEKIRAEATQVAAMALRIIVELTY